jgi:isopenicillin N synthase-like dioxygenase
VAPKDAFKVFTAGIQPQLQVVDMAHAASTKGIYTLPASELSAIKTPLSSISTLFDRLNASPELVARLNATYPKRGVFKTAGLTNALADQKTTIDLSAARLERLSRLAPELISRLGTEFTDVLDFFNAVERELVPAVMSATSDAAGIDMAALHRERNHNYRLVDYFTKQTNQGEEAARCGEHKDYGTFSIIL